MLHYFKLFLFDFTLINNIHMYLLMFYHCAKQNESTERTEPTTEAAMPNATHYIYSLQQQILEVEKERRRGAYVCEWSQQREHREWQKSKKAKHNNPTSKSSKWNI